MRVFPVDGSELLLEEIGKSAGKHWPVGHEFSKKAGSSIPQMLTKSDERKLANLGMAKPA